MNSVKSGSYVEPFSESRSMLSLYNTCTNMQAQAQFHNFFIVQHSRKGNSASVCLSILADNGCAHTLLDHVRRSTVVGTTVAQVTPFGCLRVCHASTFCQWSSSAL